VWSYLLPIPAYQVLNDAQYIHVPLLLPAAIMKGSRHSRPMSPASSPNLASPHLDDALLQPLPHSTSLLALSLYSPYLLMVVLFIHDKTPRATDRSIPDSISRLFLFCLCSVFIGVFLTYDESWGNLDCADSLFVVRFAVYCWYR
jgi:hypothetical protein